MKRPSKFTELDRQQRRIDTVLLIAITMVIVGLYGLALGMQVR